MKVAHILKALNPGGIEAWLKDLSYVDKNELYYLVQDENEGFFDREVEKNDVKIIKTPFRNGLISYSIFLYKFFKTQKIDVVHSHVNLSSGWILFLAFLAGVKVRIAHCHNDKRSEYKNAKAIKKAYFLVMKLFVNIFANEKISVSVDSAKSMFYSMDNVKIIPCGLSFKRNSSLTKSELGLCEDDIVLTHIGRFVDQKNHDFVVEILSHMNNEKVKLLLVGQGDKEHAIRAKVMELGLQERVFFLGIRNDVNELLHDVSDFFILPSKFEGLGLVAVEAQSNNVYTLVSQALPDDVKISDFIEFLEIEYPEEWANKIKELILKDMHEQSRMMTYHNERFTIQTNMEKINKVYKNEWS
ncbi:glycosyltransferase [Photobacterium sp. DA100]|uniref:glycosyltransferase n=1 Tax=Photobacterium sp. DA100 TaxID=3027472 RepID=UPI00247A2068|nr:glycosyltransferase [Photobacterium sp. DA100]WEM41556.1 glycosyltransferase [Photobacterium sp. DA100]